MKLGVSCEAIMRLDPNEIEPCLARWLVELSKTVENPKLVAVEDGLAYRYQEVSLETVIFLRLGRIVSGIKSLRLLHENGFLQEQASLQRMQDEFVEEVEFLSWGIFEEPIEIHQTFLAGFFRALPAPNEFRTVKIKGRNMPRRDKIRAFLARKGASTFNQSLAVNSSAAIHQLYSDFLHGYYPQVMDLFSDDGRTLEAGGITNPTLLLDGRKDLENYYFRCVQAFAIAAKALQSPKVFDQAFALFADLEKTIRKD